MAAETRTFYEYLTERAKDPEDSPAGDFILDAEADGFFPREARANAEGFAAITNYLYYNRGGWDAVLEAFMETWCEYYRDATGEEWIDRGYSCRNEPEDVYTITGRILDDLKSEIRL